MGKHNNFHKHFIGALKVLAIFTLFFIEAFESLSLFADKRLGLAKWRKLMRKMILTLIIFCILRRLFPNSDELLAFVELFILIISTKEN